MHSRFRFIKKTTTGIILAALATFALVGCSDDGPAIEARPQTISFSAAPAPGIDVTTATVAATATSGLPVTYNSLTPLVCSVDSGTGVVTGKMSGTCTVAADQSGDTRYAPAPQATQSFTFSFTQSVTFDAAPAAVGVYDRVTVSATTTTGKKVSYRSTTPNICTVAASTGLVTALAAGDCIIAAEADTLQATQTIPVSAPPAVATPPGAPTGVTATAGANANTVIVQIGAVSSGGKDITGYTVTSSPSGISLSGQDSPLTVTCPASCSGYAFSVTATNEVGTSLPSVLTDIMTAYNVVETFYEPDTQPNNSIFIGSFTLNATKGTVSNLRGILSESMTGGATGYPNDTMNWLTLDYQLSSLYDATLGGLLVTTFRLNSTNTLLTQGGDGWMPGAGNWFYYGYTSTDAGVSNPGNAYARIFVNTANPTAKLTQAQLDKLAYADCAPRGMMGFALCMTGTSVAGYGSIGSMSGYPVSQTTTKP